MDMRLLRYFVAVADEKSFSRAAQKLHISQPSLSVQLRKFEESLSVTLIDRSNYIIKLTPAGRILREQADKLFELVDETKRMLLDSQQNMTGTITIASIQTVMRLATNCLSSFNVKYPKISFDLFEADAEAVFKMLGSEIIEGGFARLPLDESVFEYLTLSHDDFIAIFSSASPMSERFKESIPFEELVKYPLMLPPRIWSVMHKLEEVKDRLNVVSVSRSVIQMLYLLDKHRDTIAIGPGTIRSMVPEKDYRVIKIDGDDCYSTAVLAWKKDREQSKAFQVFLEECRLIYSEEQ